MASFDDEIEIGEFSIGPGYGEDAIQIRRNRGPYEGEASDFPIAKVEALIRQFYEENF